jgi:TolB-like protein
MSSFFTELKRRNVVRVGIAYVILCWLAVQVAEAVLPGFGAPEWIFKTLVFLLAIGFPFVLIFAWAFELTPDGLKKTRDVDITTSVTSSTAKKINALIIGSLVLALGYFVWERQALIEAANQPAAIADSTVDEAVPTETADEEEVVESAKRRSIAVLPFVNMSSDAEQEWFADGLTEEILNSLARTPDLLVAARTSSFKFKGSNEDIPTIAAALGVEHVLEGSVRRSGDRLRVTAQLIRAHDGFHLWSQNFDRTLDDVIEIQEQVAIEIADALDTAMDPAALARMVSTGTASVPAYEEYLKGLADFGAAQATGDEYLMLSALEAFEKAVALDPEFASAYRRIALIWSAQISETLIFGDLEALKDEDAMGRYTAAIDKAIEFENSDVQRMAYRADKAHKDLNFLRAVQLNTDYLEQMPLDSPAHFTQMSLLRELGYYDQLEDAIERYYDLNSFSSGAVNGTLTALLDIDRPDLLRQYIDMALEQFGDDVNILYQVQRAQLWLGDIDGAAQVMPIILASDLADENKHLVALRQACAERDYAKATRLFERGLETFADDLSIVWLSNTIMGRDEEATKALMHYEETDNFVALADFLSYGRFDATQFPNFHAMLESRGVEPHPPLPVPFRCEIESPAGGN